MKRIHLFEFNDMPWFPSFLRKPMIRYLSFITDRFGFYDSSVTKIASIGKESENVIGLCCGAAGDFLSVVEKLTKSTQVKSITLTDKYPDIDAFLRAQNKYPDIISFEKSQIDATKLPDSLLGLRVMYSALHHFKPNLVRAIIKDSIDSEQPIALFDICERKISAIIPIIFITPLVMIVMTILMQPLKMSQILLTYTGILPIIFAWDTTVSYLRAYTVEEIQEIVDSIPGSEKFYWSIGSEKHSKLPFKTTYILGSPQPFCADSSNIV